MDANIYMYKQILYNFVCSFLNKDYYIDTEKKNIEQMFLCAIVLSSMYVNCHRKK